MRDLVFKNLTSQDRKRKVLCSCEISDKDGVHSVIQRHFICIVREVKDNKKEKPLPELYVVKEHNSLQQKEKFSCKLKGSVYAVSENRIFLILYMHTLNITVTPLAHLSLQ
jgi:hypothetical protein